MTNNLTLIEELDIEELIREPFSAYVIPDIRKKKAVAYSIIKRKNEDIILISSGGFLFDSVFAGMTEEHIHFIALNGPKEYKDNLLTIIKDSDKVNKIFEIANAMDQDLGGNATKNQERVRNIIQYIKDNKITFQF